METAPTVSLSDAFLWLSEIGFHPERIRAYVTERAGFLLPLRWPDGIFVQLGDVSRFTQFLRRWPLVCDGGEGW